MQNPNITIYTDGACSNNPGAGGIGAVLIYNQVIKEISGFVPYTTNNQMELLALIVALDSLKKPCNIQLFLDSNYVKDGITKWILTWKKNNWKNSQKQPVKNIKLWQHLDTLTAKHNITYNWVKGHSGNKYNEIVDNLATQSVKNQQPLLQNYLHLLS